MNRSSKLRKSIEVPLTSTPYQIRSSLSGLKNPKLTSHLSHILQLTNLLPVTPLSWSFPLLFSGTALVYHQWNWSYARFIIFRGMGWWPYPENGPPTSNEIFWCPKIFSLNKFFLLWVVSLSTPQSYNMTICIMTNRRALVTQKKLQWHWPTKPFLSQTVN